MMQNNQNISRKELTALVQLAKTHLVDMGGREDLETHYSDREDFLEVSVWELKSVLVAAYNLGKQSK